LGLVGAFALGAAARQGAYPAAPVTSSSAAIVLRGQCKLAEGKATVKLPDWFDSETRPGARSVFLSTASRNSVCASEISNGSFTVEIDENGDIGQTVSWLVVADRK
jgi:hypothetical protein